MAKKRIYIPDAFFELAKGKKIELLDTMLRIRQFETRVEELFLAKRIPGFVHLYIGEEAIAAGIMESLAKEDFITSTHRGHGHAIAKGAEMKRMMAELFGKKAGYCKGKGGSMHIADFSVGMLGANGVVGGGFNLAVGAALSAKMRKSGQIAVCFFGDGASNRGTFHEAVNLASIWQLPVVFINENNQYASTTASSYAVSVERIADRAAAYGIPGLSVDGNDVSQVYNAGRLLIERAREGEGPALLECRTYRVKGHYVGDPEKYRTKDEVKTWFTKHEPISRYFNSLLEEKIVSQEVYEDLKSRAEKEVEEAVSFGENAPYPEPEEALDDLFSFSPGIRPEHREGAEK
jgi:acetoin:2,6-dichlorophenolindophenol oxidoreductase subunit alpha